VIIKLQKYLLIPLLIISFVIGSGCGILHPPKKDKLGFYTAHYYSCGPEAVQEALTRYCQVNGIKFKKPLTRREISQDIQRNAPPFICNKRKLLIILDRDAAEITWPNEIKTACQKYGVKLTKVSPSTLWKGNNPDATYIVLTHKAWTLSTYHWYAYPGNKAHTWGDKTIFDVVYMLEPVN
jgi:hypothetical protein